MQALIFAFYREDPAGADTRGRPYRFAPGPFRTRKCTRRVFPLFKTERMCYYKAINPRGGPPWTA